MAKILIWPDLYKERGHWLPTTTLAKALVARGHTVEYMGIKDCETIVTDYGFTFHTILEDVYPLGYTIENDLDPRNAHWKPHHLFPIARGAGGLADLLDSESGNRPDLLIAGYFTSLETLLIHYKYDKLPFVITSTFLRHPDEDPYMMARTQLVHLSENVSSKLMDTVNPLSALPGQEPPENTIREFVLPLATHQEMIPCPQVFDFEHYRHAENTTYVEPMITGVPDVIPDSAKLPTLPDDTKVVFGTAGSMVDDYIPKARLFFEELVKMMSTAGMEKWHLILSVGTTLFKEFKNIGKSNVSVYSWLPQAQVLERASVCFSHGGLATLKEAIYHSAPNNYRSRVPIVVVPLGKDQMDNALRVKRSGVGVKLNADNLTAQNLRLALTRVTTSPWIGDRLSKLQAVFAAQESQNPRPSVSIIESALSEVPIPPVV